MPEMTEQNRYILVALFESYTLSDTAFVIAISYSFGMQ